MQALINVQAIDSTCGISRIVLDGGALPLDALGEQVDAHIVADTDKGRRVSGKGPD